MTGHRRFLEISLLSPCGQNLWTTWVLLQVNSQELAKKKLDQYSDIGRKLKLCLLSESTEN